MPFRESQPDPARETISDQSLSIQAGAATPIRILIVAAVRLYREGLAQVLDGRDQLTVLATAANRRDAVAKAGAQQPQVVLLDMSTPESHLTSREIGSLSARIRVVALAVSETEGDLLACAEAGLAGFVPRESSLEDLITTIQAAARDEVLCSPSMAGILLRRLSTLAANQAFIGDAKRLTGREREIVLLIDHDLSNKEIARRLGIEVATVKNHVHNVLDKLHVTTRVQAAECIRFAVSGQPKLQQT